MSARFYAARRNGDLLDNSLPGRASRSLPGLDRSLPDEHVENVGAERGVCLLEGLERKLVHRNTLVLCDAHHRRDHFVSFAERYAGSDQIIG